MNEEKKELSREEEDFYNASAYSGQLIKEILVLFKIYCGMCGEHAKESEHAFARAIFFTLFGYIEATCRVIATFTLFADSLAYSIKDDSSEPNPIVHLTESEKQFLRQETEEITPGTWTTQHRSRFVSLQDALIGYPTIYARMFQIDVSIDKSCSEWQDFIRLKRLRDIGAHGNTNELRSSPDSMHVTYQDIKRLLECRRWYCSEIKKLPWFIEEDVKYEIKFLDRLLEAGF